MEKLSTKSFIKKYIVQILPDGRTVPIVLRDWQIKFIECYEKTSKQNKNIIYKQRGK